MPIEVDEYLLNHAQTMSQSQYYDYMIGEETTWNDQAFAEIWAKYPDINYFYVPGKRIGNIVESIRIVKES